MVTKIDAARIATSAGIPVVLTTAEQAEVALAGEPVGTLFHPRVAADRPGCSGYGMPATRVALWSWMPGLSGAHPAQGIAASAGITAVLGHSPLASRWSWSVPMGWLSPAVW